MTATVCSRRRIPRVDPDLRLRRRRQRDQHSRFAGRADPFVYDGNQVVSKTFQDSSSQLRVDFTYDPAGNVVSQRRYADVAGTDWRGGPHYGYDGGSRSRSSNQDADANVLANYSYSYEACRLAGLGDRQRGDEELQPMTPTGNSSRREARRSPGTPTATQRSRRGHRLRQRVALPTAPGNYSYDAVGDLIRR